jgi:hypothetical protein
MQGVWTMRNFMYGMGPMQRPGFMRTGQQFAARPMMPPLWAVIREQRVRRLRAYFALAQAGLTQATNRLDALDRMLATELGDGTLPASADIPYATNGEAPPSPDVPTVPTTPTTPAGEPPATPTAPTTPATTTPAPPPPSNRTVFRVFDGLEPDDFTDEGFPAYRRVNDELERLDEPRLTRTQIEERYNHYVHERQDERLAYTSPKREPGRATRAMLYDVFDTITRADRTQGGDGPPRVSVVRDRLGEDVEPVSGDQVREAWDAWRNR